MREIRRWLQVILLSALIIQAQAGIALVRCHHSQRIYWLIPTELHLTTQQDKCNQDAPCMETSIISVSPATSISATVYNFAQQIVAIKPQLFLISSYLTENYSTQAKVEVKPAINPPPRLLLCLKQTLNL